MQDTAASEEGPYPLLGSSDASFGMQKGPLQSRRNITQKSRRDGPVSGKNYSDRHVSRGKAGSDGGPIGRLTRGGVAKNDDVGSNS